MSSQSRLTSLRSWCRLTCFCMTSRKRKLKIAVWHNMPSGGGKRALYHHIQGLVKNGHTVEAWCPPTADSTYLPLRHLIPENIIPFDWQEPDDSTRFRELVHTYRAVSSKLAAMDSHCARCAEEINKKGFEVLFANSCMFFRVTSIGRHVKLPSVLYLGEP